MEAVLVPIVVALIGGPLMWLLRRLDKKNDAQHATSLEALTRIEQTVSRVDRKVERLDERLDRHIDWHVDDDWQRRRGA